MDLKPKEVVWAVLEANPKVPKGEVDDPASAAKPDAMNGSRDAWVSWSKLFRGERGSDGEGWVCVVVANRERIVGVSSPI